MDAQRSVCEVCSKKQMWAQLCEAATEDGTGARWVQRVRLRATGKPFHSSGGLQAGDLLAEVRQSLPSLTKPRTAH